MSHNKHECPNSGCNNQGWYTVHATEDIAYQEQCEWCWTSPESVFHLKGQIAKLNGELADARVWMLEVVEVINDHPGWLSPSETELKTKLRLLLNQIPGQATKEAGQ